MLEQRRLKAGAAGEMSSESSDSEDDKMLSGMIAQAASPSLAKKFNKYVDHKIKGWQQNMQGQHTTREQKMTEKALRGKRPL